jgi:hypothetical protein
MEKKIDPPGAEIKCPRRAMDKMEKSGQQKMNENVYLFDIFLPASGAV